MINDTSYSNYEDTPHQNSNTDLKEKFSSVFSNTYKSIFDIEENPDYLFSTDVKNETSRNPQNASYIDQLSNTNDIFNSAPKESFNLNNFDENMNTNNLTTNECTSINIHSENKVTLIKTERMLKRDSIYKKVKSKFFQYILNKLKNFIIKGKKICKLSSDVINNVTFEYNKTLFSRTLQEIYIEESVAFRTDKDIKMFTENNNDFKKLKNFLSFKISKLYESYLNDYSYEEDKKRIFEFETSLKKLSPEKSKGYLEKYDSYSKTMLDYFKPS